MEATGIGDIHDFVKTCHACHAIVKARDFVFTSYAKRWPVEVAGY